MKFYIGAVVALALALGAAFVLTETTSNTPVPMSSSADDSSMKTLKID